MPKAHPDVLPNIACAFAAKFSAVALIPVLGVLALVTAIDPEPLRAAWRDGAAAAVEIVGRRRRLLYVTGLLAAIAAIAVVVIWGVYRFRFAPSPGPGGDHILDWDHLHLDGGVFASLVSAARQLHLLPEAYLYGFADMLRRGQRHVGFLMGAQSTEGWWYYFPVTFALKTPLALVVLLAAALAMLRRRPASWRTECFLWVPPALYAFLAMSHRLNIGHRHLLPAYPFLFIAAGRAAAALAGAPGSVIGRASIAGGDPAAGRAAIAGRAAVAALAGWYAVAALLIYPHQLAYFNELAGGPDRAYRFLVDSNLDWGQDLKGLKGYMDANSIPRIKLSYFGTADPKYYGIACDFLPSEMRPMLRDFTLLVRPGDLVAISATNLQGVYLPRAFWPFLASLRDREPVAVVGHSIFVYRSDFTWMMRPEVAREVGWLEQAVRSYLEAIRLDPAFAEGYGYLGMAMHLLQRPQDAATAFEKALSIDPRYMDSRPEFKEAWIADRGPSPGAS